MLLSGEGGKECVEWSGNCPVRLKGGGEREGDRERERERGRGQVYARKHRIKFVRGVI